MVETRSQRQAYLQRPPYPQITTTASAPPSATQSVFQSSSSLASLSSVSATPATAYGAPSQASLSMFSQPFASSSAPLPSPSAQSQATMNYFAGAFGSSQAAPTSHPMGQQQQRIPPQQQYQYQYQQGQSSSAGWVGQRGDGGGMPETAPFLKDFNLVAEAAKRAQMACLERDLGDVGL